MGDSKIATVHYVSLRYVTVTLRYVTVRYGAIQNITVGKRYGNGKGAINGNSTVLIIIII